MLDSMGLVMVLHGVRLGQHLWRLCLPHEDGKIEKHIDRRLQRIVQCLETEPIAVRSTHQLKNLSF